MRRFLSVVVLFLLSGNFILNSLTIEIMSPLAITASRQVVGAVIAVFLRRPLPLKRREVVASILAACLFYTGNVAESLALGQGLTVSNLAVLGGASLAVTAVTERLVYGRSAMALGKATAMLLEVALFVGPGDLGNPSLGLLFGVIPPICFGWYDIILTESDPALVGLGASLLGLIVASRGGRTPSPEAVASAAFIICLMAVVSVFGNWVGSKQRLWFASASGHAAILTLQPVVATFYAAILLGQAWPDPAQWLAIMALVLITILRR